MKVIKKMSQGFTLVELMVVVAIIGLLSAVAIPNFQKYQSKAKTSEAKLQLAAAYTAEISMFSDYDAYATCLRSMGYSPVNESAQRYYAIGFQGAMGSANTNILNANGATDCIAATSNDSNNNRFFAAGKSLGSTPPVNGTDGLPATAIAETSFTIGAAGYIDKKFITTANNDQWTIQETKKVTQVRVGY